MTKREETVNIITNGLLAGILCGVTLFATSRHFVNREVTPKWFFAVFCVLAGVLVYAGYMLFSGKKRSSRNIPSGFSVTVTVLCALQAL
jgi:hypothetical protein